jgi:beta-N-acetylhexosaminidase
VVVHSLQAKIGQMFVVGCRGETLAREERLMFEQCGFGGFILFKDNCREAKQILALCKSLWQCAGESPPFLAIDHEGGRVHRLPEPFARFPSAEQIGAKRDPDFAYRTGKAAAGELALAGFNLNFAPVLDVNSNPQNPLIADRSFGSDPGQVIQAAFAWTQGLRDGGVVPCGKHFPGHGDTETDSHFTLPDVKKTAAELEAVELAPFARACRAGIEALMTAHVRYPALDAEFPATLSEPIVTGLLRRQLGYDGVVFSDDMEMKAIADHFSLQEAVLLGARAGIDVFLFCHDLSRAVEAWEFLSTEAEKDAALRAQVENSFRRIAALKERCVKGFTGVSANDIESRLRQLHRLRLVDRPYGSL